MGKIVAKYFAPVLAQERFELVLSVHCDAHFRPASWPGSARTTVDADLSEWDYGDYKGLTPQQIRAKVPEWLIFREGCPGGESPAQIGARVDRVIAGVRAVEGNVALFAHGHVLRALAARWLGLPTSGGSHFLLRHAERAQLLPRYRRHRTVECRTQGLTSGRTA